jgi:hypothetical protein
MDNLEMLEAGGPPGLVTIILVLTAGKRTVDGRQCRRQNYRAVRLDVKPIVTSDCDV